MENSLTPIQTEILKAIEQMVEKASFTEFILAKKIRMNNKLEGKKKAGISLGDLLAVLEVLETKQVFYSIHVNSVNDILLRKETSAVPLSAESRHRRLSSEKSMEIFTSGDLKSAGKNKMAGKKRKERKRERYSDDGDRDDEI